MKLGNLSKVTDLRSVWPNEAKDFTKWISLDHNLSTLGKEIGLNLSLIKTEAEAGDFAVDILAEESESGKKVIIENQLERTDHDHLGKIITYASGYEANTIIWIVKEFRSEHKSAIDWLNEHTDEKINFFGIAIELWQIGDSDVAPKFNIISQPNSWTKTLKSSSKKGEMSEIALKQMNFFEDFISYCNSRNTSLNLGNPQPSTPAYYSLGIGISGVSVAIKINTGRKLIKVDLYFIDKDLYNQTKQNTEIQAGQKFPNIVWDDMPKYKGAAVGLELKNFVLDRQDTWEGHYAWLKENTESLVKFFYPEIMKIKNGN
jgi:hypothetical protein